MKSVTIAPYSLICGWSSKLFLDHLNWILVQKIPVSDLMVLKLSDLIEIHIIEVLIGNIWIMFDFNALILVALVCSSLVLALIFTQL